MRNISEHINELLVGRPKLQDAVAELMNPEAHPTANGVRIMRMVSGPFEFEWHPKAQNLYYMRNRGPNRPKMAEIVAFNIVTHGDAKNAVLIWFRGFAEGKNPDLPKVHLQL